MFQIKDLHTLADTYGGIVIYGTLPNSPAYRAGVLFGDILLSVNGRTIDSLTTYRRVMIELGEQDSYEMEVIRGAERLTLRLDMAERAETSLEEVAQQIARNRTFAPALSDDTQPIN